MQYKIYTQKNLADTSRDPDEYVYKQLGYQTNLDEAVKIANAYIKENFFNKDTKLRTGQGKVAFTAHDFCSYGETINIEENESNK